MNSVNILEHLLYRTPPGEKMTERERSQNINKLVDVNTEMQKFSNVLKTS